MKKTVSYGMVLGISLIMALNYQLFVFPNSFAPAGLNGIFTMIQHVAGFKLSYTSIILNIPLAIVVFFVISKPFALRSMVYTLAFSGFLILFDAIDLSAFKYDTTVSILSGPEGGFAQFEADLARACGLHICSMGERILRCETAPVVALTATMYATGNLC